MRRMANLMLLVFVAALAGCTSATTEQKQPAVVPKAQSTAIASTTDATFERDVIDSAQPVLVDFYASWCGPCRQMEPILSDLAGTYKGRVKVVRVNVEENPALAKRYRISAIPRLMLFKNGSVVDDMLGATSRERGSVNRFVSKAES